MQEWEKSPGLEIFYSVQQMIGFRLLILDPKKEKLERGSYKKNRIMLNATLQFLSE